jgi:hypothetical protein
MSGQTKVGGEAGAPLFGAVGQLAQGGLADAAAVGRLIEGVKAVAEAARVIAIQRMEQARIRASARAEVARVHAVRDVMLAYLDHSFDERRASFDALFVRLDTAMAQGNVEVVAKVLDAVVELAQSSPFKDLADASKAKVALQDKARSWEF